MTHEVFRFKDRAALEKRIEELGLDIPLSDDISILFSPIVIAGKLIRTSPSPGPFSGLP